MRTRHSFLLTLLPSEENRSSIHGKIKTIATGRTSSFSNLDELYELLKDELKGAPIVSQDIHSLFSIEPCPSNPNIPD
jgi:hypothetical protein